MDIDFSLALDQLQNLINGFVNSVPSLLISLILLLIIVILAGHFSRLVAQVLIRTGRPRNLALVLSRLTQWSVIGLGLLLAFLVIFPGFSVGELIQLLGFGGVVAGLVFRNIFEDFLAGILLLLTEPYKIGDQIIIDHYEGTIEEIQTRITFIRTYDGRRVVIPNASLMTNTVVVNTAYDLRRIDYDLGIGYSDSIEGARQVVLETLNSLDEVQQHPPPEVLVFELAPYSIMLRLRWWIRPPKRRDALDARNHVLQAVREALLAHGVDLPFPTHQILFHDQTEATDGDRRRQREGWPAGPGDVPPPYRTADGLYELARTRSHTEKALGGEVPQDEKDK